MAKIIKVTSCLDCPELSDCGYSTVRRAEFEPMPDPISDTCPLPDETEEFQKILESEPPTRRTK